MRRTISLLGAIAGLFLTLLVGAPASYATTYAAAVATSCNVSVPNVATGDAIKATIQVTAAGSTAPTGTVKLTVTTGSTTVYSETVSYNGSAVTVTGPSLPAASYNAAIAFTPSNAASFTGCSATDAFTVGSTTAGVGGLPNTGGPHLYLLALGLGLVAGGSGLVGRNRLRRRA